MAADLGIDAGVRSGQELAVEVPNRQAVGRRIELGVHLRLFDLERVEIGDQVTAHAMHVDELVEIFDGKQASFETYSAMTTSRSNSHDGQITAPMSSVVKAVNITTGQQIKTGDVLVLVEAMKMEYPLTAPFDGIVEDISCETGDAVTDGQILMHISQQADDNDKTD